MQKCTLGSWCYERISIFPNETFRVMPLRVEYQYIHVYQSGNEGERKRDTCRSSRPKEDSEKDVAKDLFMNERSQRRISSPCGICFLRITIFAGFHFFFTWLIFSFSRNLRRLMRKVWETVLSCNIKRSFYVPDIWNESPSMAAGFSGNVCPRMATQLDPFFLPFLAKATKRKTERQDREREREGGEYSRGNRRRGYAAVLRQDGPLGGPASRCVERPPVTSPLPFLTIFSETYCTKRESTLSAVHHREMSSARGYCRRNCATAGRARKSEGFAAWTSIRPHLWPQNPRVLLPCSPYFGAFIHMYVFNRRLGHGPEWTMLKTIECNRKWCYLERRSPTTTQ